MLVLGRKEEQTIQIGDDIRVTILRIKGNGVRVGIEAPDQVRIIRGELEPVTAQWSAEMNFGPQQTGAVLASCK